MNIFLKAIDKLVPLERIPKPLVLLYEQCQKLALFCANKKAGHCKYRTKLAASLRKKAGNYSYTVVTAVYNTDQYLDTYFKSLTRQSLDFKKHIRLILVDDGSVDGSADIIKKWQKEYPENITYIYQQNQGAAAARSAGLIYADSAWVTFIDSDDFVHPNYFYYVDENLKKHAAYNVKMLSCREIIYNEAIKKYCDTRPFRIYFENDVSILPHNDLKDKIQLSVASAFFSLNEIRRQKISFVEDANWGTFEDAYFVLQYLSKTMDGHCLFCRSPRYYYRKRNAKTSYIDQAVVNEKYYIDVIQDAYIKILELYKSEFGIIPKFVQNSILYDLSWKIKGAVQSPQILSFLPSHKQQQFLSLCDQTLAYIDDELILSFPADLSNFDHFLQIGSLACFKKRNIHSSFVYIDRYDHAKNLIRLRCFGSSFAEKIIEVCDELKSVPIIYKKTIRRNILDRIFIYEQHIWVSLPDTGKLSFSLAGERLKLVLGGEKYEALSAKQILEYFGEELKGKAISNSLAPWVFMDRDVQADDNAEHLYRYILKTYPEREIYFALRKSSHDWDRLKAEGFKLLDFGSRRYLSLMGKASKLISSHMDNIIMRYRPGILTGKHFVCLQHGITKDDLSQWLNAKNISLFITATENEYQSIVHDGSPYFLSAKEVVKTGFPRHDRLMELALTASPAAAKSILIIPTWRSYLLGPTKAKTQDHILLPEFIDSLYFKSWVGLLRSADFLSLVQQHGYSVNFFPHFNMHYYFNALSLDPAIKILSHKTINGMQSLLLSNNLLITDYSSVAFDFAYLQRPILYYQFDEDEFYKGNHPYTKGYFDYRKDGFGPVAKEREDLIHEISSLLERDCETLAEYRDRIEKTFPLKDGKNCERVYRSILSLDLPEPERTNTEQ